MGGPVACSVGGQDFGAPCVGHVGYDYSLDEDIEGEAEGFGIQVEISFDGREVGSLIIGPVDIGVWW